MKIGSELRDERERLGLSCEHISAATKIHVSKLAALEEDAFDQLPSGIYLDGIVAAYAREVGLDGGACVRRLRAQLTPPPPETLERIATTRQSSQGPAGEWQFGLAHGMVAFASVAVLLGVLGVAVHLVPGQRAGELAQTAASARVETAKSAVRQEIPIPYVFSREGGTSGVELGDEPIALDSAVKPLATGESQLVLNPLPQPALTRQPGVSAQRNSEEIPVELSARPAADPTPTAVSNLAGTWTLETQITSSSLRTFEGLRLGYRLDFTQNGGRIEGTGLKISENGIPLRGGRQTPIVVQGTVDGGRLRLTFGEHGARRHSKGTFALELENAGVLRGSFASDAARSAGVVEGRRL